MPSAGFELSIPATKLPQTYALDCTATGIGYLLWLLGDYSVVPWLLNSFQNLTEAQIEFQGSSCGLYVGQTSTRAEFSSRS
jgi:hypothetical protein